MSKISPTSLIFDLQQELFFKLLIIQRQLKARPASEVTQLPIGSIDLVKGAANGMANSCLSLGILVSPLNRLLALVISIRSVQVKRCLSL
jgi:hypothetical protein